MRLLLLLALAACATTATDTPAVTDADGDGFAAGVDCDDNKSAINPDAAEVCDDLDNDCSGAVDDNPTNGTTYYADVDGDGYYGDAKTIVACAVPSGYGFSPDDCNDSDATIYPDAEEACDGIDNNCDDALPANENDADADGYMACAECDDKRSDVNPGAPEVCDDRDNDCDGDTDEDGTWFRDSDADGYGDAGDPKVASCDTTPNGYVANDDDCDDANRTINPAATEMCDAGDVDEDCDGLADDADDSTSTVGAVTWYADADGDGYGENGGTGTPFCDDPPGGYTSLRGDCDDTTATASPAIPDETCGDGVDNNCNGNADTCGLQGTIDLSLADAKFIGEAAGDNVGYSVSSAGDVNADGYDDLVVGAYNDDEGGSDAGAAYLVLGPVSGDLDLSLADAKFIGEDTDDHAGFSVSSAGDVNGDGFDDILLGAYGESAAYLVLGPVSGDLDLSMADAKLIGESKGHYAGWKVSRAGDMNGDGFDDLLVGAPGDGDGGASAGAAYLVLGPVSGDLDLSLADAKLIGEDAEDLAGRSVSSAGDVDGDGLDDVIVGAQSDADGGYRAGAAYVVYGTISGDLDLSLADAKLIGEDVSDYAGYSVSSAGDVNADGYDDLLVGAIGDADGGATAGAAYVVYGPVSGDLDLSRADAKLIGEFTGDRAGISVSPAGDVNGDGYDDLLVGAPSGGGSSGGSGFGAAYLVYGPVSVDLSLSLADAKFAGGDAVDWVGCSVAPAGDVNGDGYVDIIVGAEGDDDGGTDAGAAYLILGLPGL